MQSSCIIEQNRTIYFDFLRVLALFAVIFIHIDGKDLRVTDINSFEWNVLEFYHGGLVKWAVPSFVMISGALFLSKDDTLKKIFSKNIFRIATAFIFWSFIYAIRDYVKTGNMFHALSQFIVGHYHMWFLFMIIGLYMIVPFLKKITASEFLMKYFLVLSLTFAFVIPDAVNMIMLFSEKYGLFFKKYFVGFHMHFVLGFTGYFVLGYFLSNIFISKTTEKIIHILGILGLSATRIMSVNNVNILLETISVFVFFRFHYPKSEMLIKLFRLLSQYTFGAYLVHPAVIRFLFTLMCNHISFNPLFSVPLIAAIVFIISFIISAILNHIPVLRKYIV